VASVKRIARLLAPLARCLTVMIGLTVPIGLPGTATAGELASVVVTADRAEVRLLPIAWFLDKSHALGREAAAKRLTAPDVAVATEVFSHGFRAEAIWLRAILDVAPEAAGLRYLVLALPNFDRLDVYPSWMPGSGGDRDGPAFSIGDQTTGPRPVLSRLHVQPVELPAGRHEILFHGRTTSTLTVPLSLWSPAAFHALEQRFIVEQGIYAGIVLLLVTISLALFVQLRLPEFLFYAGAVAFHGGHYLSLAGIGHAYLWPAYPAWAHLASVVTINLTVVFTLAFGLVFLRREGMPWWAQVPFWMNTLWASTLALAAPVVSLDGFLTIAWQTSNLLVLSAVLTSLVALLLVVRRSRSARYILVAWAGLIVGGAIGTARNLGVLPSNSFTLHGPALGTLWEFMVFSLLLIHRIGDIRRDKEAAQLAALEAARHAERELEGRVRKRTAELNDANERLRQLVEAAPFPLALLTAEDGRVAFANERIVDLFGVRREAVLGIKAQDFYVDPAARDAVLQRLASEGALHDLEVEMKRADGTRLWALMSAVELLYGGEKMRLAAFNDITRRKALESDLRTARDTAEAAAEQERQSRRIQRQFLEMVSHEFRTPLAIIDGAAQNIEHATPEDAERVRRIRAAVKRMMHLMDDCLAEERVRDGAIGLDIRPLDLAQLLAERVAQARVAGTSHPISLSGADAPVSCVGDRQMLTVAVDNLIGNARKYTPAGTPIAVTLAQKNAGQVSITVADAGPGIPAAERERVFERYYRSPNTAGSAGAGLGLHMVREIAGAHGGDVTLSERPGGGSVFRIDLPAEPARAAATV
jgi:PAS domain S-box-containing protein